MYFRIIFPRRQKERKHTHTCFFSLFLHFGLFWKVVWICTEDKWTEKRKIWRCKKQVCEGIQYTVQKITHQQLFMYSQTISANNFGKLKLQHYDKKTFPSKIILDSPIDKWLMINIARYLFLRFALLLKIQNFEIRTLNVIWYHVNRDTPSKTSLYGGHGKCSPLHRNINITKLVTNDNVHYNNRI